MAVMVANFGMEKLRANDAQEMSIAQSMSLSHKSLLTGMQEKGRSRYCRGC